MKKRCICVVLTLLLLASLLPLSVLDAVAYYDTGYATTDYTNWKQTSTQWASASPWSGTSAKFGDVGCYITSVSILLRHYGVVSDADLNLFNPLICNDALMAVGAITSQADLIPSMISRAYPGFVYAGTRAYSVDTLKELLNAGYACVVHIVRNGRSHFVAVRSVSGNTVTMMDPGSRSTDLAAQYTGLTNIVYYKVSKPSASDSLTISGYTYPTGLQPGAAFSVRGTVSSAASSITALTVGVYNSQGVRVTGATVAPYAKTYNLANLDNQIKFSSLGVGSYTYRVMATNGANTKTLLSTSFTVASDRLSISDYNYPTTLEQGKTFSIRGIISSANSNITSVTVGVYDAAGNLKTGKTVNPNAKIYDIRNVDAYVSFGSLPVGTYAYKVIARNGVEELTLVNQSFTVGAAGTVPAQDALTIGEYTYPVSLTQGSTFSLRGVITSASSNITSVTAGIYDTAGNLKTGKTVNPNAKSYDLRDLDSSVSFGILTAGTYYYRVQATNAAGTTQLVDRSFTVTASSIAPPPPSPDPNGTPVTLPFQDVSSGSWYYDAVAFLYSRHILQGTTQTTFEPNTPMSRAMLVVSLYRLANSPGGGNSAYSDVPNGTWYTDAVSWATRAGIVNGVGNGCFSPNTSVTREQMVTILYRYAAYCGSDTTSLANLGIYSDAGSVKNYALPAMQWAVANGIITGTGNGMLSPSSNATRAQVAVVLNRFYQTYG